ncbi:MAG TPA: hypothetical protein DDY68_06160 [Porphyromonadaceae bacterium]|nr:hypothetical protein [Porphyromonadaceae bacterium]
MLGGNGLNYEYEMERDFRKYRFIGLFWIGISMLFLEGCANIGKPDGGMKDWDAPVYLYSTPKMDQTNFHKDKLEITFDEIVGIDNSNDKIVVSPPQKKKLNVKSYGKKLVVRLRDTLKENTTYTIDFSDAVKDNNEGNRLQNFYLSFATGDTLDSMQFQGRLLSAYNLEPITGCYVGITSNLTDTAFTKTPLERLSYTDSEGKFVVRNAKPGSYKVYALKDGNKNYYYDLPTEDIAFLDTIYIPSMKTTGYVDSTYDKEGKVDTIFDARRTEYEPKDILLRLFNEEKQNLYLLKHERPERWKLSLGFSTLTDTLPILTPVNFSPKDSVWYIYQRVKDEKSATKQHTLASENSSSSGNKTDDNTPKMTCAFWIPDSSIFKQDTLLIAVDYLHTDTLKQLSWNRDTLRFRYTFKDPVEAKKSKKKKDKSKKDTIADSVKIKFLELAKRPSSTMELNDSVVLVWKEPIVKFNPDSIHLEMKKDSLFYPIESTLKFDTTDKITFSILPKEDWKEGEDYRVVLDSATIVNCFGLFNKKEVCTFKTQKIETYGNLFLTITGLEGKSSFVELLDKSDNAVLKSKVKEDSTCEFWYVKPDKYYLRLIIDENNDFQWNTGNYKEKKQPEEVFYYPSALDSRANWNVEQSWNIHSVEIFKQKPLDIVKNKSKNNK